MKELYELLDELHDIIYNCIEQCLEIVDTILDLFMKLAETLERRRRRIKLYPQLRERRMKLYAQLRQWHVPHKVAISIMQHCSGWLLPRVDEPPPIALQGDALDDALAEVLPEC